MFVFHSDFFGFSCRHFAFHVQWQDLLPWVGSAERQEPGVNTQEEMPFIIQMI